MLKKAVPLLPTRNIQESIDFYETRLGFVAKNYGGYAVMHYKNTEIHLVMTMEKISSHFPACLILVDNIEDLYMTLSSKGLIQLRGQLADKPWGNKEFIITDNNNNLIRFGQKR